MTTEQRGWIYFDPDIGMYVYRGFSFGNCIRSLVAARQGESEFPNQYLRPYLDASSGLEDTIINRLAADHNVVPIWQQKTVELPVEVICEGPDGKFPAKVLIRGHLDLADRVTDDIVEAKALGPSNFEKYNSGGLAALGTLGQKYAVQGGVYGHATQRRVRFAIGEKLKNAETGEFSIGRVIYEPPVDASSLITRDLIELRVRTIEEFAAIDELPACDMGCRENDSYGEVHIFQSAAIGGPDLVAKLARIEELNDILGTDDRKKRSGLLGEREDLKDAVKAEYGDDYETRKVTAGPFTVTVVANKGREYIDSKWLKTNHADIAAQATKIGQGFRTLLIKGSAKKADQ